MKKKYIALLSLVIASLAVTATISVGHSVWRYSLDIRGTTPAVRTFEIHFKTSGGNQSAAINYTGLEYNSYFELPHLDGTGFLGWSKDNDGTADYYVDTKYQYSAIATSSAVNYFDLYEVWSS